MIHLKGREQAAALSRVLDAAVQAGVKCSMITISQRNSGGLRVATHMQAVDIEHDGICHPKDYGWQMELEKV